MDGGDSRFARAITAIFLLLSVAKTFTHEPWRDEWGPWGVALANPGFAQCWDALRYGGHPRLWHMAVFVLQKTTGTFASVQILAALLATLSVWVVARFAPFPRWTRLLFALGYYPLFEYGSIARPYSIALPAVCAAAALFRHARRDPLPLAIALAVLAQTTVFGVILAAAFVAAWMVDQAAVPRDQRAAHSASLVAAALVAASTIFAVFQMIPPPDSNFAPAWRSGIDVSYLARVLGGIVRGILPLPLAQLHFWNTHLLDGHDTVAAVAGAITLVAFCALFARQRPAATLWVCAACGHLAFAYSKFDGDARHHGHYFLAFVASAWIAAEAVEATGPARRLQPLVVGFVLALNAAAGLFAAGMDAALPFSTAAKTAALIRSFGLAELPIVGQRGSTAAAVAAALGRPFALAGTGRTSTFVAWDKNYHFASPQQVLTQIRELAITTQSPVLLVQDRPLDPSPSDVRAIARMDDAIVADERYFLYLFPRGPPPKESR